MSGSVLATQSQQIDVFGARLPSEGPRILPLNLDFTATGVIAIDFTLFFQQKRMTAIQGVYIRNWNNPNPLTISIAGTTVVYDVPSYADAVLQIWPNNLPKLTVTTTQGVKVPVAFTNFPLAPVIIYNPAFGQPVQITGTIAGTLTVQGTVDIGNTVTTVAQEGTPVAGAHTVIANGGTAVPVFGALAHEGAFISNPFSASESLFIDMVNNAGTVAPGVNGTTIELVAGQSFNVPPNTGTTTANAVTTGHTFTAVSLS